MVGTNLSKCEWVWEEKLRWLNPRWPNSRWQNSRWLPSPSWLRMNEVESDWISLSQSQSGGRVFLSESEGRKQGVWIPQYRSWIQDGRIQEGQIQDGHHHQVESEGMNEVFCAKGGEGSMSGVFFVQMVGTNLGKYECVWQEKLRWLNPRWPNSRWQNSTWLPSSSWVRMNEFESDWISLSQSQSGGRVFLSESERREQGVWIPQCRSWIQDGRIQDGHYHHFSVNEWVKVFCANGGNQSWQEWVSLRGKTKMADSKMAKFKMAEIKMTAIIKLNENEWVWVRLN